MFNMRVLQTTWCYLFYSHPRQDWLVKAVARRVREELVKLEVEYQRREEPDGRPIEGRELLCASWGSSSTLSEANSESGGPEYVPRLKKRTALLAKLKIVFRRSLSQPVERVIEQINPILRGWVNYFAAGHSSQCFSFISQWVERKIRRHLMRAQGLQGFGWKQWSKTGSTTRSGCFMTTGSVGNEPDRTAAHTNRSHNS